jgi:hypothetical protein
LHIRDKDLERVSLREHVLIVSDDADKKNEHRKPDEGDNANFEVGPGVFTWLH